MDRQIRRTQRMALLMHMVPRQTKERTTMTVGELIKELEKHDPKLEVRGSFFSPIVGMHVVHYYANAEDSVPSEKYLQLRVPKD
jgi:hypothetical protein